jgi:hypothetical protein
MSSGYCTQCGSIQNLRETIAHRQEASPEGEPQEIETRSFHCEKCNTFVRSEDTEILMRG